MAKIVNNKSYIFILVTVIILVTTIACISNYVQGKSDKITAEPVMITSVSWAHGYNSIDELSAEADLIAIGTIGDVIAETHEKIDSTGETDNLIYFTDFSFKIDRVLKGEAGTQITIHQTGATGKQEITDDPLFVQGEQYILFLREYEEGRYCVLGGPQGRFMIIDDVVFSMNCIFPDKVILPRDLNVDGMQKQDFTDYIAEQMSIQ